MAEEPLMAQTYGIEAAKPAHPADAPPARFVVLIESASAGRRLAHVLLASREAVAEFDASAPEVLLMTQGLAAQRGAGGPEWDRALAGHARDERAAAEVYTLDV